MSPVTSDKVQRNGTVIEGHRKKQTKKVNIPENINATRVDLLGSIRGVEYQSVCHWK